MLTMKQQDLHSQLSQGITAAQQLNRSVLISYTEKQTTYDPLTYDPLTFFVNGSSYKGQRFFWINPTQDQQIVGLGAEHTIATTTSQRYRYVQEEWDALLKSAIIATDDDSTLAGPTLLGGFSFDPYKETSHLWSAFPDAKMILPRYMLSISDNGTYLTINRMVSAHDDPDRLTDHLLSEKAMLFSTNDRDDHTTDNRSSFNYKKEEIAPNEWKQAVEQAAQTVRDGKMAKIVLARELRIKADRPLQAEHILDHLIAQQPHSYIFAIESESSCFLGASPERLVKRQGSNILSTCLAGTTQRGNTPREDEELGLALLNDEKNRHEHDLVVQMIRQSIEKACDNVHVPDEPTLYKVRDIQHLYTPVTATARDVSLLKLVENLHPTPALGGYPQKEAVEKIRSMEQMDRGWYASPIGWYNYKQEGEFAVGLRSGLINEETASFFAGCGIVGDSDPESEYRETQMKFRPMLSALGGKET